MCNDKDVETALCCGAQFSSVHNVLTFGMGHPASASITIVIGHETLKIMLMTFCGIRFRWSQRLCAVCVDATGDTSSFLFTV